MIRWSQDAIISKSPQRRLGKKAHWGIPGSACLERVCADFDAASLENDGELPVEGTTPKRGNGLRRGTRGLVAVAILAVVSRCGPACAGENIAKESCEVSVAAVTQCLLDAVAACRDAAADRLLDSLVDTAPPLRAEAEIAARRAAPAGADAHTLLAEYQPLAETAQTTPAPRGDEVVRLLAVAQTDVAAAVSKVLPTVTEQDTRRLLAELSLVLPFLASADDRWDGKATAALLRAPLRPEHLPVAENFALHCGRPLTAWEFARAPERSTGGPEAQLTYLQSAAARMNAARDPQAAVSCCRAGIRIASAAGYQPALRTLTMQLADALAGTGNPLDAARQIEGLLAGSAQVKDRSALVSRRFDLLYKGGAYAEALHAAETERNLSGADNAAPEVLHMLWACHRRLGHGADAEAAAAELLRRFPRHSLAAGILFGQAMDALKALDCAAADSLLAQVQKEFPGSTYATQATEFRKNLAVTFGEHVRQP